MLAVYCQTKALEIIVRQRHWKSVLAIHAGLVYTMKERFKNKMEVYNSIYDIVAGKLEEEGERFGYRKSTFLCDVGMHPQNIDIARFLELDNHHFYEAIYVAVFRRLPEEKETVFWEGKEMLPREQFQKEVLKSIAGSSVVAINQIKLINNPYFSQKIGLKYHFMGTLYGLTDKSCLREFGKKLPQPIQNLIRKVFL